MKIGKMMCILLAVMLLAGFIGGVSGETISSVLKFSVATPETNEEPGSVSKSTTGITITKTTWSPDDDTFDASTAYTVTITVSNNTGYTFAESTTAKINDEAADSCIISTDKRTATISYTFPATQAANKISEITISNLETPKPTATPDKSITISTDEGSSAVSSSITWSPADSIFQLDKEYTVKIILTPSSKRYTFDSSVDVEISGLTLNSSEIKQTGNNITITHKYPKTEPLGKISYMNLLVNAPSVGTSPSTAVTTNSNMFDAKASWYPTGVFKPDQIYSVTISVTPKSGYVYDSTVTATVNGVSETVSGTGNTRTIIHTFGQLSSVDVVDVSITAPTTGGKAPATATSVTTTPTGSANSATIKWTPQLPATGEFEAGVEYMATITIPVTGNIGFDGNTVVKVNGQNAKVEAVASNYKTITATYTFPKTSFIPNPIEIIKEFFNLMLLMVNPASYAF